MILAEKFTLALMKHTINIPKYYRYTIAYRLDQYAIDLLEKLSEARYLSQAEKIKPLNEADMIVSKIKIILRLSYELQCISIGLLEELTKQLHEIGKILGALKENEKK